MTASESDTSAIQPAASGAQEELWLTYVNYDQSIGQAVRRLGALSPENVDLFRGLLLKSRDRSKVKDYEAESIRRLQGEAFVGDEELQRTLIVLTAEDPRFGEELKRLVAATGKPEKLDQAVAAIRSGKTDSGKPAVAAPKDQIQAIAKETAKEIPQEAAQKPIKEPAKESIMDAVVVPLHKERAAPAPRMAPRPTLQEESPETKSAGGAKRLAVIGAIVLAVVAGVAFFVPINGNKPSDSQVAAVPPPPQAAASAPAPAAPTPPAPAVDIPLPAQADKNAPSSPPLRPASAQPDAQTNDSAAAQPSARSAPVAGSNYTVVRGDMLSDIAFQVYGDASKFRLIQAANPRIRNKDRILVDQVIFIPPDSGSARQ